MKGGGLMTNLELIAKLTAIFEEAGVKYIIELDDDKGNIDGTWYCSNGSRLDDMVKSVNKIYDIVEVHNF